MSEPIFEAEQTNCECEDFNPIWDEEREQYYCDSCGTYQD